MTADQAERIAKALESIAESLLKMANPPRKRVYFRGEEITPGSLAEKAAADWVRKNARSRLSM